MTSKSVYPISTCVNASMSESFKRYERAMMMMMMMPRFSVKVG
jgi:hypothetical protein